MADGLESWPRPYFEEPGGRPFLFFVAYGEFPTTLTIDAGSYRTLGVHPGLVISRYGREEYPDVLAGFEEGYLWDELKTQDPELARRVSGSGECLILRGELDDRGDLDYLRDSVGLMTWLLDHGGVCVYDPQMFRWWGSAAWRRQVFEPAGPVPRQHVVILTSGVDGARPLGERPHASDRLRPGRGPVGAGRADHPRRDDLAGGRGGGLRFRLSRPVARDSGWSRNADLHPPGPPCRPR